MGEFAEHRKTGQMDWANATGLSDNLRTDMLSSSSPVFGTRWISGRVIARCTA